MVRIMKKPTEQDYAYAAGLIDGEGSFVPVRKSVRLVISMTDKAPLVWMHKKFGGTLRLDRKLPSGKDCWRWQLNGKDELYKFIYRARQYMKVKGHAADTTLAFLDAAPLYARWTTASEKAWQDCVVMNH